ncbi:MAG: AAA family ATPase [Propionibacteriaceae bacterium]|nr:AAA family ATPase [Propionibacteriaceae bacterium]
MRIIGRALEQDVLRRCLESGKPEFLAVYGRRRVGKTFLIREAYKDHVVFCLTGAPQATLKQQLRNFDEALDEWGGRAHAPAKDWFDAFRQLKDYLRRFRHHRRKVVFIDEISWLATQRSAFLAALDHFWNSFASTRDDLILVICGSATSWIIDNIVNARGGLHNRLTRQLRLDPFSLAECELYCRDKGIQLNRVQLAQLYMVLGGIPYYLDFLERGQSPEQAVDALFFARGAPLAGEYANLYASLFKNPERHLRIIDILSRKTAGATQRELFAALKAKPGGTLSKALLELEQCGFIRVYHDFTKPRQGRFYQLSDFYTLFYHHQIRPTSLPAPRHWQSQSRQGGWNAWYGLAFERLVAAHLDQVRRALGISGVTTAVLGWRSREATPGVQIDLIIRRADGIVDLLEAKFTAKPFALDEDYDKLLLYRRETFCDETKTDKAVHIVMVSASGLTPSSRTGMIQNVVTLDDLFA